MGLRKTLFDAAEKLDAQLGEGIERLPSVVKTVLVFILGGLAGEAEWEDKRMLSYMLLGLGFVVALGAFTLGQTGKPPKGRS